MDFPTVSFNPPDPSLAWHFHTLPLNSRMKAIIAGPMVGIRSHWAEPTKPCRLWMTRDVLPCKPCEAGRKSRVLIFFTLVHWSPPRPWAAYRAAACCCGWCRDRRQLLNADAAAATPVMSRLRGAPMNDPTERRTPPAS